MKIDDPFAVLGVTREAGTREIKKAFRRKARETHPDLHPNDPGAAERFQRVHAAYQQLKTPALRSKAEAKAASDAYAEAKTNWERERKTRPFKPETAPEAATDPEVSSFSQFVWELKLFAMAFAPNPIFVLFLGVCVGLFAWGTFVAETEGDVVKVRIVGKFERRPPIIFDASGDQFFVKTDRGVFPVVETWGPFHRDSRARYDAFRVGAAYSVRMVGSRGKRIVEIVK